MDNFKETKDKLDKISSSFCVAKWNQVSLHLESGMTHSCHHPAAHKIPLIEIEKSPHALHNTIFKKEQRKLMLEGVRPKECDYCWKAEDASQGETAFYSDRITKSSDSWAVNDITRVSQLPWDADVFPTYLEISFDNTCNFKCMYCSPRYSNTWKQEIEKFGPYELPGITMHNLDYLKRTGAFPIPISEYNPYVEAFWKWFPEAISHLHVFRITGGEPLLSKQLPKILDFLIENPQPQLEFNVNSNLDVPAELIDSFIKKMQIIVELKAVKSFKLYTSNEAHGEQAEYIRFGLNYDRWLKNCHKVLNDIPNSNLTVMAAFNILSITSFKRLMDDISIMKRQYLHSRVGHSRTSLDVPYVRYPTFLSAWVAPIYFLSYIEELVTYMQENLEGTGVTKNSGFFNHDLNRFERLYRVVKNEMVSLSTDIPRADMLRKQFSSFIQEYDRRRNTNFIDVFPEFEEFITI
jgi:organic radical activating enzyme